MITIAELLEEKVMESAFLEEGLARGIINLSALAREFKPQIESRLMKPVTESSLIMALKRMAPKFTEKVEEGKQAVHQLGDLTVRSDLTEFTFARSETLLEKQKQLLHEADELNNPFITFTQGVYEITIIVNSVLEPVVQKIFKREKTVSRLSGLASITIRLSTQTVHTPGVYYSILKQLVFYNINVVEVVSTYTEFTIILLKEQVDLSFSILMKYMDKK
jgi:hypothetical protein